MMLSDLSGLKHYDPSTIEVLRRALGEVLADRRFYHQRFASALEIAEHLLVPAASGERDFERLKSSAFARLSDAAKLISTRAVSKNGVLRTGGGSRTSISRQCRGD
jgi:hypothetical protein